MSIRRQGRELALKMIYSLNDQVGSLSDFFADFWDQFRFREDVLGEPYEEVSAPVPAEVRAFAEELVRGVNDQLDEIDAALQKTSTHWSLGRMARVDLALLRLGAYELMYRNDIPVNVAINEAVEIGKRYGTKETPSFVNGVLDRISRTHRAATPQS